MAEELRGRLAQLRRRVQQVLLTYGVSLVVAVVIGATLLIGVVDWWLHHSDIAILQFFSGALDDPGVRLLLLVGLGLSAIGLTVLYLVRPLRTRLTDLDLALQIEARHPQLKDTLASTISFLDAGLSPAIGSPRLQQSVIQGSLRSIERTSFDNLIQTGPVKMMMAVAIAVCLVTGLVVGLNQRDASIALHRLVSPWSAPPWPRRVNLRLLDANLQPLEFDARDPVRIARGDTLQFFVENQTGSLPQSIEMQYRLPGGKLQMEDLRASAARDARGDSRDLAVGQILCINGPIQFRAQAGDHTDMPFYTVIVVPPPIVEKLNVKVTPPTYSGEKPRQLELGVGQVEGLVGTQVEIRAALSKPVRAASLKMKDQTARKVQLSPDRRMITAKFSIEQAGIDSWWLDLRDDEGFQNVDAPRYEIQGLGDAVPEVVIEAPLSDLQVTPDASLPVRLRAHDDLRLKEVRIRYRVLESTDSTTQPFGQLDLTQIIPRAAIADAQTEYLESWDWEFAELSLQPGQKIAFAGEATDHFDLGAAHVGRSSIRVITIVPPDEKRQEIADRQATLLENLERVQKLQELAQSQVKELQVQAQSTGKLRPQDIDTLQRAELSQRQVKEQLTGKDGLRAQAQQILDELEQNKIDDAETQQRVEALESEMSRIASQHLPPIENQLTSARKQAQSAADNGDQNDHREKSETPSKSLDGKPDVAKTPAKTTSADTGNESKTLPDAAAPSKPDQATGHENKGTAESLRTVANEQTAVLESLREMTSRLSRWRDERDSVQELAGIKDEQDAIRKDAASQSEMLLSKPASELTPQEKADLAKLAERQRSQAGRFERFENRLRETIEQLEKTQPGSADPLQDAAEAAREASIAPKMRDSADLIEQRKIGQASEMQRSLDESLTQIEDLLRGLTESDTETLVKKLKQAEQELADLRNQEAELFKKIQEAKELSDPAEREAQLETLGKQQEQLQNELGRISRQLKRLQRRQLGENTQRALDRLSKAQQQLQDGDADGGLEEMQEALDDLEQAQRELAEEREQAEEQLASEQVEKIADELKSLIPRQQSLIDEVVRLDTARNERWTRAFLATRNVLIDSQKQLREDTEKMAAKLSAAEVFALALKGAVRQMSRAESLLDAKQTGTPTQAAQKAALERFEVLIDALKPEKPSGEKQEPQEEGPKPEEGPETDGIPILAELKLLRTMQIELKARTEELLKAETDDAAGAEDRAQQLAEIAEEQGKLADLARNLSKLASGAAKPDATDKE